MDDPALPREELIPALRGLERINSWSRSPSILWPHIRALAMEAGDRALHVLDLATGAGDVPMGLADLADAEGLSLVVDASDRNPASVEYARTRAGERGSRVRFFVHDPIVDGIPARHYDVIACSLFLHHLDRGQAARLLDSMAGSAGRMVLLCDLVRSRLGLCLAWMGTRLLTGSEVVHRDGPVSVRSAYTPVEVMELARRAGMHTARITPHWPLRFLLSWRKV